MLDRLGRHIYHPAIVLPLLALAQLMIALDFSFAQLALVLFTKSARFALHTLAGQPLTKLPRPTPRPCHCDAPC